MATFFPEGMPLPAADRDSKPFWDGCKEHKLLVQRCKRCGTYRHPPTPVCYMCHSFESAWEESQGVGEVFTFTIVHHPVLPATRSVAPYNAVVVQLRDCGGVKITSNLLDCKNEEIRCGMPVQVVWEDATPQITLPRFRPLKRGNLRKPPSP